MYPEHHVEVDRKSLSPVLQPRLFMRARLPPVSSEAVETPDLLQTGVLAHAHPKFSSTASDPNHKASARRAYAMIPTLQNPSESFQNKHVKPRMFVDWVVPTSPPPQHGSSMGAHQKTETRSQKNDHRGPQDTFGFTAQKQGPHGDEQHRRDPRNPQQSPASKATTQTAEDCE